MGFWGIEVKPGRPHPYHSDNLRGKLHVTQATLGSGLSNEKSILQCSIGHKNPIYLCSLFPEKNECCPLNLEFEDDYDLVAFSVIGPRSIHLSGYFESEEGDYIRDEYDTDPYGEDIDITETESDDSSEYDSEGDYDDYFIDDDDDDLVMYLASPVLNSGVVIEEIKAEEKPTEEKQAKRSKKKNQSGEEESTHKQIAVKGGPQVSVLESEDEDGFPITKAEAVDPADKTNETNKEKDESDAVNGKKRKVKATGQDGALESENKRRRRRRRKKKKEQEEKHKGPNARESDDETNEKAQKEEAIIEPNRVSSDQNDQDKNVQNFKNVDNNENTVADDNSSEKKKKKKKKKKNKKEEAEGATNKSVSDTGDEEKSTLNSEDIQSNTKYSHVRNYPNGLIVEEIAMGKPDGKRASPGK